MTGTSHSGLAVGIDLGGTKIEIGLYHAGTLQGSVARRATPAESYVQLLDTLTEEVANLRATSGQSDLPVGIAVPGIVAPDTGVLTCANLVAHGQRLGDDLRAQCGGPLTILNDAAAFALSEARGGAGDGHARVYGLVIGTGIGGALIADGTPDRGATGIAGEIGHAPLPAALVEQHDLPLLPCGCGQSGCYETLVSGPGLSRLLRHKTGLDLDAKAIAARLDAPDIAAAHQVWLELMAELFRLIRLTTDPDCIVLGGGVSQFPGLVPALLERLETAPPFGTAAPVVKMAKFGAASGGRGAALMAVASCDEA